MFEGIALVKNIAPGRISLYIYQHNLGDQKLTNAHLESLQSEGLKPIIFTHALFHDNTPERCPYCISALNEHWAILREKEEAEEALHGPTRSPQTPPQQSGGPNPPLETGDRPRESRESLSHHFRSLPGAQTPPSSAR